MTTDEGSTAPSAVETPAQRRRGKGRIVAQIIGIVGLVGCIVLAVAILIGHGWVSDGVGGIFDTGDKQIERGRTLVQVATNRLQERVTDLDDVITNIQQAPVGGNLPPALATRVATIVDRYSSVRDSYAAVRARIDSALETLQQVGRALPFLDIPSGPTEELAALDQLVQDIDDSLNDLTSGAVGSARDRVVQGATRLRAAIGQVAEAGNRLDLRLAAVQTKVEDTGQRIETYLWLTTIGLWLIVAYVAVLNILIIWLART